MKKILFIALCFVLGIGSASSALMWYEGYNYSNGPIQLVSTIWFRHSGNSNDALVFNNTEQVAATGGVPVSRSDDVHRLLPAAFTNSGPIKVYASFTVIVTNLPSAAGGY